MQDMYLKDGRNFLYVGDVGRKLVINLPNLNIIRVCYETKEGFTKDVKVENFGEVLYADIPDLFLSGEYSALTCYAIATDGEYAYTASEAHFEIKDRQKSKGYSPTEQQLITWDYIERKAAAYMQQTEIYMNHAEELAINAGNAADSALQSKNASEQSEANARQSETNSKASEEAAKLSKTNAKASEEAAKQSEDNAQTSADNAESSADSALQSKNASSQSEANARQSEINAKASETAAKQSETNAKASEEAAKQSEDNAQASANNAESSAGSALQSKNASAQSEANAKLSETNAKASETAAKQSLAEAQQIVASKADKTYVDSNLATKADKSELAVERARIDSLSTLPEGSTTGDAELIGIRIGADGVTYPNAGEAVRTQILNEKTSRETAVNELKGDLDNLYIGGNKHTDISTDKWIIDTRLSGYKSQDGYKVPNISSYNQTNLLIVDIKNIVKLYGSADLTWNIASYTPIMIVDTDGHYITSVSRDGIIAKTDVFPWLAYLSDGGYEIDIATLNKMYENVGSIYICQAKSETCKWYNIEPIIGTIELKKYLFDGVRISSDILPDKWILKKRVSGYVTIDGYVVPNISSYDNTKYTIIDITKGIDEIVSIGDLTWNLAQYSPITIVDTDGHLASSKWSIGRDAILNKTASFPWLEFLKDGGYRIDVNVLKATYPNNELGAIYICQANGETVTWHTVMNAYGNKDTTIKINENTKDIAVLKDINTQPFIVVPSESVAVVGHEWNMYFENIIGGYSDAYYTSIRCTDADTMNGILYDDCVRFTPNSEAVGSHTVYVYVYSKVTMSLIAEKEFTLHVIDDVTLTDKKVIFIGDSLTDDGYYVCEIQGHLSQGGITSIGTKSDTRTINGDSITASNEGRGGWTTTDYMTKQSVDGVENPFYNPSKNTFDFEYYMNQNGFSNVDVVSIYLGTNGDSSFDVTLSNIDAMIESIHFYNSDIKVIVCLFHQTAEQSGVGNHNGLQVAQTLIQSRIRNNQIFIDRYENNAEYPNVYIAELNFAVDGHNDYAKVEQPLSARNPETIVRLNNNVHPNVYGYLKIADVLYNRILYLLTV